MSRWISPRTIGLKSGEVAKDPSGVAERLVKYIPGEVVTAFTVFFTTLASMSVPKEWQRCAATSLIALFLIVTIVYTARAAPADVRRAHLIVAPIAFLAWAYPISSSLLGDWFVGIASLGAQALVIALAIAISPTVQASTPAPLEH